MSAEERQHWIAVDGGVFSAAVVMKAAYWLSGRYVLEIRRERQRMLTGETVDVLEEDEVLAVIAVKDLHRA